MLLTGLQSSQCWSTSSAHHLLKLSSSPSKLKTCVSIVSAKMSLSADEGQRSCHDLFKVLQQLDKFFFLADVFTHLGEKREFRSLCYVVFFPYRLCFLHITHSQDSWIFKFFRDILMLMTHHSDSYSTAFRLTPAGTTPAHSHLSVGQMQSSPKYFYEATAK